MTQPDCCSMTGAPTSSGVFPKMPSKTKYSSDEATRLGAPIADGRLLLKAFHSAQERGYFEQAESIGVQCLVFASEEAERNRR